MQVVSFTILDVTQTLKTANRLTLVQFMEGKAQVVWTTGMRSTPFRYTQPMKCIIKKSVASAYVESLMLEPTS